MMKRYAFSPLTLFRPGLALACPMLLMSGIVPDDYSVTGIGWFYCYDGSLDTTLPLAGARVILMDSDCDGSTICDDEMGSDTIRADGRFEVTGKGGDPGGWSWSRPDVYIRVVFNDGKGVRLTDELDWDRYTDTPTHDHDNTADGSTVDFGSWTSGTEVGKGEGSRCGTWLAGRQAYTEYTTLMGEAPPAGKWDIEYWSAIWAGTAWTNDNTSHWPIHYRSSAAAHEFAHSVRHRADGDRNHFNWDVTRFRYARYHDRCDPNTNRIGTDTRTMDLAFGFNEGWSEYWDGSTWGCPDNIDEALEGNIAWALAGLSDLPGVGRKRMVEVLKANPGGIHSLDEFLEKLSPMVGRSASALTQAVDSARPAPSRVAVHVSPPVTMDQVRATMQRQAAELSASIQLAERELAAASEAARSLRPCLPENCEVAFRAAVRPIMLRADIEIRRLAQRRLEALTRLVLDEAFYQKLATGELEGRLTELRNGDRRMAYRIQARSLEQARRTIESLSRRSPGGELVAREFDEELGALRARAESAPGGGINAAGIARLEGESPRAGRFAPRP
jgi:hypothetical protein